MELLPKVIGFFLLFLFFVLFAGVFFSSVAIFFILPGKVIFKRLERRFSNRLMLNVIVSLMIPMYLFIMIWVWLLMPTGSFWLGLLYIFTVHFLLLSLTSSFIKKLPAPKIRRASGERKNQFTRKQIVLGFCLLGALLAIDALLLNSQNELLKSTSIGFYIVLCYLLIVWLFICYNPKKGEKVEDILISDDRQPILYLRTFAFEEVFFWFGNIAHADLIIRENSGKGWRLINMLKQIYPPEWIKNQINKFQPIEFEMFFKSKIKKQIGPFIALGDPTDFDSPEGAARTYYEDNNWKEYARSFIEKSKFILLQPGDSQNLRWELEVIRQSGLMTKLFIPTPPAIPLLPRWIMNVLNFLFGNPRLNWSKFNSDLSSLGYIPFENETGMNGMLITFSADGNAIILGTNLKTPIDYLRLLPT